MGLQPVLRSAAWTINNRFRCPMPLCDFFSIRPTCRYLTAAALILCLWSLRPATGHAEEVKTRASARLLFDEGRRLVAAKKFSEGCEKLEQSLELHPGLGTQFNLASCYEQLGKSASAWRLYKKVVQQTSERGQAKREALARERLSAVEPRLSRLTLVVPEPEPQLTLSVDGAPIASANWDRPLPLDPGSYQVTAEAPGYEAWMGTADLRADRRELQVAIPPLRPLLAAPHKSNSAWAESDRSPPSIWLQPAPWLFAAGGGALVAAGAFGLSALHSNGEAEKICVDTENSCAPAQVSRHVRLGAESRGARMSAWGFTAAGALCAVLGFYLWPESDNSDPELSAPGFRLQATVRANSGWLHASGSF